MILTILRVVTFIALFASSAWATDRYISPTGSAAEGTCRTPGAARCSFATAIAASVAGDNIFVGDGTYTSQWVIDGKAGTPSSRITIRAENIGSGLKRSRGAILRAGTMPMLDVKNNSFYLTIQGIKFDAAIMPSGGDHLSDVVVRFFPCVGFVQFIDNEIVNSIAVSLTNYPGSGCAAPANQGNEIRANWIHDGGVSDPVATATSHAVYAAEPVLIENNWIENVSGWGVHGYQSGSTVPPQVTIRNNFIKNTGRGDASSGRGGGILLWDVTGALVYNNVVKNVPTWAIDVETARGNDMQVYNNTIITPSGGIGIYLGPVTGFQNFNNINCGAGTPISDNGSSGGAAGTNLTSCPSFTNAAGDDYSLTSGATAAIDQGTDLSSVFNTDYAGIHRPQGAGWDIGAFEFASSASLPVVTITAPPLCPSSSTFSNCTFSTVSSTIQLVGTSKQSGGSVAWACDRCIDGGTSGTASNVVVWTTPVVPLLPGTNNITVTGTDSLGNAGTAQIKVTYQPTFPGNALVAAYGFEDGSGTSATDSSGNANPGTLVNGPTWVTTGRYGKALSFDGTNDFVSVPDQNWLDLTQSFTLSAWVQPTGAVKTDNRAIIYKNSSPISVPYSLYASSQGNSLCTSGTYAGYARVNGDGNDGNFISACGTTLLQTNVWTHITVTYDGSQVCLYKNADNATKVCTSGVGYMETSAQSLRIGGSEFGENFQGLIDEARVYNYAIPITAAGNTSPGATCSAADEISSPSIVGDMNCPVVPLAPPMQLRIGAGTTLKFGAGSTVKFGASQ